MSSRGHVLREGNEVGHARFVFNTASALPWVLREGVSASSVECHEEPSPAICWRLLSPNNRQLGRSADVFDDLPAGLRAVEQFLIGLDEAEPLVTRHTGPVRWTWRVLAGNQVVAMSGRSFEAERQAVRTLEKFLATAVLASAVPELMGSPTRSDPCPDPLPIVDRWRVR
jgi:hypothetical protein